MREWYKTESGKRSVRATKLKQHYGITVERYEAMLTEQNHKCLLCGMLFGEDWKILPRVDHDHACCSGVKSCGKCVRGLLCAVCNAMLGFALDNTETLSNAIQYLNKFKETQCNQNLSSELKAISQTATA
jgi:hypothetical protein